MINGKPFGVGIVRDKNGKPKFDDIDKMPDGFKMAFRLALADEDIEKLSDDEKTKLGVNNGNHASD